MFKPGDRVRSKGLGRPGRIAKVGAISDGYAWVQWDDDEPGQPTKTALSRLQAVPEPKSRKETTDKKLAAPSPGDQVRSKKTGRVGTVEGVGGGPGGYAAVRWDQLTLVRVPLDELELPTTPHSEKEIPPVEADLGGDDIKRAVKEIQKEYESFQLRAIAAMSNTPPLLCLFAAFGWLYFVPWFWCVLQVGAWAPSPKNLGHALGVQTYDSYKAGRVYAWGFLLVVPLWGFLAFRLARYKLFLQVFRDCCLWALPIVAFLAFLKFAL